jgi:phosphoglycerate dehydrogenase-like enzyme
MPELDIVAPESLVKTYGDQIRRVSQHDVRLISVDDAGRSVPKIDSAEIMLHGFYSGEFGLEQLLPGLPRLKWIHALAAGIEDIAEGDSDLSNLVITNASGGFAQGMAEYVVAGMVMLSRNFSEWIRAQQEGHWVNRADVSGSELRGKTVLIVGYGGVGRHVARLCSAVGMDVYALRRRPLIASGEPVKEILPFTELHSVLPLADFVVLSASLNSSTRGLFGQNEFAHMRPGGYLINVARGELVDQDALIDARENGNLGGALLDVTTPEPLPEEHLLWRTPNVWITPHVSGNTPEGYKRGIDLFCENLALYVSGQSDLMGNRVDLGGASV